VNLAENIKNITQRTVIGTVATAVSTTNQYRGRTVRCDKKSIQYFRFIVLANFNTLVIVCKLCSEPEFHTKNLFGPCK